MTKKQKPQMKRSESRLVRLPQLVLASKVGQETANERNVVAYDYCRRSARPILNDAVIKPFSEAFKNIVFDRAKDQVGLNDEGIIGKKFSHSETLDGIKLVCSVAASSRVSHGAALEQFKMLLERNLTENIDGIRTSDVGEGSNGLYVSATYLRSELRKLIRNHKSIFTKMDLSLCNPLDEDIDNMRVYLALQRYAAHNPENAHSFHNAKSLDSRLRAFMDEVERRLFKQFGIKMGTGENAAFDYELSDGSGVRYLFYPKSRTDYGKVVARLFAKATKEISRKNGDLDLICDFGFASSSQKMGKRGGIVVTTEQSLEETGKFRITRVYDKDRQEHTYRVMNKDGTVLVRVQDVLDTIKMLEESHTSTSTQLKMDFFPGIPAHLK
jgi:hypothetical protein